MTDLVSIETTPNPNSMKLNLSEPLGITATFTPADQASAPQIIRQLLGIDGGESVFTTAAFITLNRDPRADWQPVLQAARAVLTGDGSPDSAMEDPLVWITNEMDRSPGSPTSARGHP